MKISELIKTLEMEKTIHGDLQVRHFTQNGSYEPYNSSFIEVAHLKIRKGREQKNCKFQSWEEDESRRGEKVLFL